MNVSVICAAYVGLTAPAGIARRLPISAKRNLDAPIGTNPLVGLGAGGESALRSSEASNAGLLIVNADDWGRDCDTTERTVECVRRGSVSSVSAMVFMKDSERASVIAREQGIDAGLHLNFTTPFSAASSAKRLVEHQEQLARYLLRHRFARVFFHPGLTRSFEYVVTTQLEEFRRLYGAEPGRIDGHHHMHLCANVVLGNLLPLGSLVRRNFSFQAGEKCLGNRLYRRLIDRMLRRRNNLVDFLFALPPLEPPDRLERICSLARRFAVEVETHPVNPEEYRFLMGERFSVVPEVFRLRPTSLSPGGGLSRNDDEVSANAVTARAMLTPQLPCVRRLRRRDFARRRC